MIVYIIWSFVGLLAVFSTSAVVVFAREVRRLRRGEEACGRSAHQSWRGRMRDYVGPIDTSEAPLNRPLRVTAEFFAAILGFPGIGWMVSGRIAVGLPLVIIMPAVLWMVFPLYVSTVGLVLERPLQLLALLPLLALASAGSLAVFEYRRAPA